MLGQDAAAIAGGAGRRHRGPGAGRGHDRGGRRTGVLAGAGAVELTQAPQAAALQADDPRALEMGDARHLAARVRPQATEAGAQAEHAALGARHARQAAAEAQDGLPQGALATLDARGATLGLALRRAAALTVGAGRARARGRPAARGGPGGAR
jgi:hypothetical protein